MTRALIVTAGFLIAGMVLMQSLPMAPEAPRPSALPDLGRAPEFVLQDSSGESFGSDQLSGRPWVVNFFFSSCGHICPTINGNMAKLVREFKDSNTVFVSITVDPERDTTAQLVETKARFAPSQSEKWRFLRGEIDVIERLLHDGFKIGSGNLPSNHSTRVVLIDPSGQMRGYYRGLEADSMQKLASDLRKLLQNL